MSSPEALSSLYQRRIAADLAMRQRLWRVLCDQFFQRFVAPEGVVLELLPREAGTGAMPVGG